MCCVCGLAQVLSEPPKNVLKYRPLGKRDELAGQLRTKPGLRRFLRRTKTGLLRTDHGAIKREAHLDGKWLLRTSDLTPMGAVGHTERDISPVRETWLR